MRNLNHKHQDGDMTGHIVNAPGAEGSGTLLRLDLEKARPSGGWTSRTRHARIEMPASALILDHTVPSLHAVHRGSRLFQ